MSLCFHYARRRRRPPEGTLTVALVHQDFDSLFRRHYEAAYRLAFLLCRRPDAARRALFQAMLALAAAEAKTPEQDEDALYMAVLAECDGYYLKKPRRLKKREQLQTLVPFPITDAMWQALKAPMKQKTAVFLRDAAGFAPARIAKVMRQREASVEKLLSGRAPDLRCVKDIAADRAAETMPDDIHLRFAERSVAFELKVRRFKRTMDRIVPYIAAAIIVFCIAAILYTASLPVN